MVLGYDETAFPPEAVRRVWAAWQALLPTRTLRFGRQDAAAPASVLVSLDSYGQPSQLQEALEFLRSEAACAARESLQELFAACTKPPAEFQFRCDVGGAMVRGRFVPENPEHVSAAPRTLWDLARDLKQAGLPDGVTVVVAAYRGGWKLQRTHGFHADTGRLEVFRYCHGRWEREGQPA